MYSLYSFGYIRSWVRESSPVDFELALPKCIETISLLDFQIPIDVEIWIAIPHIDPPALLYEFPYPFPTFFYCSFVVFGDKKVVPFRWRGSFRFGRIGVCGRWQNHSRFTKLFRGEAGPDLVDTLLRWHMLLLFLRRIRFAARKWRRGVWRSRPPSAIIVRIA